MLHTFVRYPPSSRFLRIRDFLCVWDAVGLLSISLPAGQIMPGVMRLYSAALRISIFPECKDTADAPHG